MATGIDVYNSCIRYVSRRIHTAYKEEDSAKVLALNLDESNRILIVSKGYIERLWEALSVEEMFILDESSRMIVSVIDGEEQYDLLCDHIAFSVSIHNRITSVVRDGIVDKLPDFKTAKNMLYNNPWLIYVYIFEAALTELKVD